MQVSTCFSFSEIDLFFPKSIFVTLPLYEDAHVVRLCTGRSGRLVGNTDASLLRSSPSKFLTKPSPLVCVHRLADSALAAQRKQATLSSSSPQLYRME